jgi:hypothetical protein
LRTIITNLLLATFRSLICSLGAPHGASKLAAPGLSFDYRCKSDKRRAAHLVVSGALTLHDTSHARPINDIFVLTVTSQTIVRKSDLRVMAVTSGRHKLMASTQGIGVSGPFFFADYSQRSGAKTCGQYRQAAGVVRKA